MRTMVAHRRILILIFLIATRLHIDAVRAQVAHVDETAAAPQSPANQLQPLAWLIGEWVGTTNYGAVLVSSQWSDGGNYIVREFLLRGDHGAEAGGTQRIGWDPINRRIKSWTFDSQGGSGEGVWRRDGERWAVDSTEVTADGQQVTLSAVYTPVDDRRFVWEIKGALSPDRPLPAQRIEFTRAADDP